MISGRIGLLKTDLRDTPMVDYMMNMRSFVPKNDHADLLREMIG